MHQLLFAVLVRLVVLYELTDFYGSLFFTAAILLLSAFMFNQDNLNQRFVVNSNLRFLAERDRCVAYVLRPFYAEPENLTIFCHMKLFFYCCLMVRLVLLKLSRTML